VTLFTMMNDREVTKLLKRFWRALRKELAPHGVEFVHVHEWQGGTHHHHFLIRTQADLTTRTFGEALAKVKGGLHTTHYCRSVEDVDRAARYIVKHGSRIDRKAEVVPESFAGKVISPSRGFLIRPFKQLWREVYGAWYSSEQQAPGMAVALPGTERHG
jgi:hypothetical protein